MSLPIIGRSFPIEDIAIRSGGGGRTVVAYCAVFDSPYEVADEHGRYIESIHRSGFNRRLATLRDTPPMCLYNHGFLLGTRTPSERFSMPLGTPLLDEFRADARGLLTVTKYANTPLADEALELIRSGALVAQSFRGAIYQSRPMTGRDGLPGVERMQLGLIDYGPTPAAVAHKASIVGVRSNALLEQIADLTDEERAELLANLSGAPVEPATPGASVETAVDDPDAQGEPVVEPTTPPDGPSDEARMREQAQRRRQAGL